MFSSGKSTHKISQVKMMSSVTKLFQCVVLLKYTRLIPSISPKRPLVREIRKFLSPTRDTIADLDPKAVAFLQALY